MRSIAGIFFLCLVNTSLFGDDQGTGQPYSRYGWPGSAASYQVISNPANEGEAPNALRNRLKQNQGDASPPGNPEGRHFENNQNLPPAWRY